MTDRISRRMISLYASLSTFIVILITLFSYFHSIKQNRWLLELLQRKVFYLPLIVHIVLISLLIGLLTFLLISLVQKGQYGRLKKNFGYWPTVIESPVLNKPTTSENQDHYLTEVEQDIWSIKNKLLEMSKNCNY